MHADIYTMLYGNYRFTTELDTGSETGEHQLTIWFAEKVAIEYVHLAQFSIDLLLQALQEPMQSRLQAQLEQEKMACQQALETQIATLQLSFQTTKGQQTMKQLKKMKQQIRQLHQQMNNTVQHLEADFIKGELIPLERECFDLAMLQVASHVYGEPRFLRDFYFEEVDKCHIEDFCQKFALDEAYRQDALAGRTHWAKRNALFMRNLPSIVSEETLFANDGSYDRKTCKFFYWLDEHCEEILALPEYQWLQEIDGVLAPNIHEIDPDIKSAVDLFNRIPDAVIQFSCQGVSGKVRFQEYDLLTVSSHREYGFVSFSSLGPYAHDAIIAILPLYSHITTDPSSYNFTLQLVLRSTGDNLSFRKELLKLAHQVLEHTDESWQNISQTHHISRWQDTIYPEYCPRTSAPGGIIPSRLDWLCQPEQVERTLHLLFYLNHWAKARDHLLYNDRQGLYKVKAAVLQQAYKVGAIRPVAYVDGSKAFARDYCFNGAIDIAAEVFIERLAMSFDENGTPTDKLDIDARKLFVRIMGYEAKTQTDSEALEEEHARTFIDKSLQSLVDQARSTRQPISSQELAALFIYPADLFEVYVSRDRHFPNWDELDENETKQLDPEGLSLIAFQYNSSTAHYVFHLPFRIAERFLPQQLVRELQSHTSTSREAGIFYGRAVTKTESQDYPIVHLLRELLVDISAVCPHGLVKKEQHVRYSRALPVPAWNNEDEPDDAWYEDCLEYT